MYSVPNSKRDEVGIDPKKRSDLYYGVVSVFLESET